ncbi:pseudouridine synthase [Desulfovibrio sp.]|uniref:RNA pseudouridine synthase n=1 Tax=Desulfovibrio sp. TaxID=885 RepID=UPI0023C1FB20|nr:pseudouridine synthase [Desulfovibrio sp.]MDE7241733.1 pseudouridine synthase [Desulfovibrio sp.]
MRRVNPGSEGKTAAPRELVIGGDLAGARLDRALAALVPDGLRGRRRRIEAGGAQLNGAACRHPARRMKPGDLLSLAREDAPENPAVARLLGRSGDFCFLFKGPGLHCAALAGKGGDSLEGRLSRLCAPVLAPGEEPELLQRLDQDTSGIVCATLNNEAARAFRAAEAAGRCEKRYLALLTGALAAPVTAHWRLDTANRRDARLLDAEAEPLRRTEFLPLHAWEGEACARLFALLDAGSAPGALTLAACRIRMGARHQIRAHAAALGHPLLGDARYAAAGKAPHTPEHFFLHHGLLAWPGHRCSVAAPWRWLEASLPPGALRRVRAWLETAD